jgi:uncharacterized protein
LSAPYLLDANALVALVLADHEHHQRTAAWAATVPQIALCPIVEGALFRYLLRVGQPASTATEILAALYTSGRAEFWPDSITYIDVDLGHVTGHRQVTDTYLAAIAHGHGALLATLDAPLATTLPDRTLLIL